MFLNSSDSNIAEDIEQLGSSGSRQTCSLRTRNSSCSIIRKSVIAANCEEDVGELQEVAELIEHSNETAQKAYM